MSLTLHMGDCRAILPTLAAGSVQCVVTSPPYWGLRDYGVDGQIGLEETPEAYVETMVGVFCAVRRVLRDDGTVWLNLGDSYAAGGGNYYAGLPAAATACDGSARSLAATARARGDLGERSIKRPDWLKPKDLVGIPWRVAFALQADGWFLRSDIIWAKPNPMPESVTDRPTKAHEYVFLLSKSARYYYDGEAIREANSDSEANIARAAAGLIKRQNPKGALLRASGGNGLNPATATSYGIGGRNARTVWSIASEPYPEAHFATFPAELARRCILAGSRMGDTVLDPFAGSGTVGEVAERNGRDAVLIELSPAYVELARARTAQRCLFTYRGAITMKTPEDETEHLPPDDEDEDQKEAEDDCTEVPVGPPPPEESGD
jgi:DNA modification methylase